MAVPYTFGSATTSIPLSQLDSNFATAITLGNTAVQLGNTITSLTGVSNVASATSLSLGSNGNTTAVTIDTSQNVGIGTSSPGDKLVVSATSAGSVITLARLLNAGTTTGTASRLLFTNNTDGSGGAVSAAISHIAENTSGAGSLALYTPTTGSPVERMRIDSSGNVGISGTPSAWASAKALQLNGSTALWNFAGTNTYLANNEYYNGTNRIFIASGYGTEYQQASGNHIWSASSASGTAGGTVTNNEYMRLDSSGNLLVGTTSNLSGVNGFQVSKNAGAASYAGAIVNTKTDNATVTNGFLVKYTGVSPSDGNYMFLCQDSGNTNRFYVTNAGSTGGTSDANLKKNIETTRDGYAEDLCKIRIVKYNWKEQSDDTPKDLGWIAQEVEQVFPRMIKTDADTGIKSVTHSAFVPMLIKAIQELKAINDTQAETINALTARVVALESK